MKKNIITFQKRKINNLMDIYPLLFLIFFYGFFHVLLTPGYWDDAQYKKMLGDSIVNLLPFLQSRYILQTSRIAVELTIGVLSLLPYMVWKILDLLTIILLYGQLKWFISKILQIDKRGTELILAFLLCAYPFSAMASAGWVATTANYLWVIATGSYAVNRLLKVTVLEERLSIYEFVFTVLALLYSTCFETVMILMLAGISSGILYQRYRKRSVIPPVMWTALVIAILYFFLFMACPGNRNRLRYDTGFWMTEFAQLTLFDKVRIGVVHTFLHFVSIPSPLFFILNICCLAAVWVKTGYIGKRMIGALPVIVDIGWTCYFLGQYFLGNKVMTYQVPEPILKGGVETAEQIGICISVAIWFAAIFYSSWIIFKEKRNFWLCVVILVTGCVPEIVVAMTPTVVTSMLRTTIYLYMAIILVIVCVYDELQDAMKKYRWIQRAFYSICAGGIGLNAIQLLRHISIYG